MEFRVVPEKDKHKAYDVEYQDLTQAKVQQMMDEDVTYVQDVLGVDVSVLSSLPSLSLQRIFVVERAVVVCCACACLHAGPSCEMDRSNTARCVCSWCCACTREGAV
jgi:ariadne-1